MGIKQFLFSIFRARVVQQMYVPLLKIVTVDQMRLVIDNIYCSLGFKVHFYKSLAEWQSTFATQPPSVDANRVRTIEPLNVYNENGLNQAAAATIESEQKATKTEANASEEDNDPNQPNLSIVLCSTPKGKTLISHYNRFKSLNSGMRELLVAAIGDHYAAKGKKSLTTTGCWSLGRQIERTFDEEDIVSEIFS